MVMKLPRRIPASEATHERLKEFADKHHLQQGQAIDYLLGHVKESHQAILKEIINTLLPSWKNLLRSLPEKDKDNALQFLKN